MDGGWGWDELCECCTGTGTGTDFGTGTDPIAVNTPCSSLMSAPYFLQSAVNAGGTSTDSNDDLLFVQHLAGPGSPTLTQSPIWGRPPGGWKLEIDGTGGGSTFLFIGFELPIRSVDECRPLYQAYLCLEAILLSAQTFAVCGALMQDGELFATTVSVGTTPFFVSFVSTTAWKGIYQGFTETSVKKVTAYNQSSPYLTLTSTYPNFNGDQSSIFIGVIARTASTSGDQEIHLDNWVARRDMACCGGATHVREYAVDTTGVTMVSTGSDPVLTEASTIVENYLNATFVFAVYRDAAQPIRYYCRGYADEYNEALPSYPSITVQINVIVEIGDCVYDTDGEGGEGTIAVRIDARIDDPGAPGGILCYRVKYFAVTPTCSGNSDNSCCGLPVDLGTAGDHTLAFECVDFDFDPGSTVNLSAV